MAKFILSKPNRMAKDDFIILINELWVIAKMRFDKLIWIPLTLILLNCRGIEDKLFWIDKMEQHENDFLFLAQSTNVEKLKADSLTLYLGKDELANYDTGTTNYKNFGQIYKGDKFKVFVLLRSIDTQGRDRTRLRKRATAKAQTLGSIRPEK